MEITNLSLDQGSLDPTWVGPDFTDVYKHQLITMAYRDREKREEEGVKREEEINK